MADNPITTVISAKNPQGTKQGARPAGMPSVHVPVYTPVNLEELYQKVLPYLIIDVNNVPDEMVKHTANYAYLTQELAKAKGRVADMRTNLDYQKGLRFVTCKYASYQDANGKKCSFTDTMAKAYVDIDDDVVAAKQALADAERVQTFWQMILDAMYQRSYMLTKLAEMQQHELLLAGNEYNEGIKQQIRKELSDDEYMGVTEQVRRDSQRVQAERLKQAMEINSSTKREEKD